MSSTNARRPSSCDELVTAARGGDPRALDALVRDVIAPTVRGTCRTLTAARWTGDAAVDIEDVMQLAVLAAVRALPRYEQRNDASFRAYVRAVARNVVYDTYRHDGRLQWSTPTDAPPETPDPALQPPEALERATQVREAAQLVDELLADLPPSTREVLMLRVGHELSSAEVARALGTTPGAVRVIQHRALRALRERAERRAA